MTGSRRGIKAGLWRIIENSLTDSGQFECVCRVDDVDEGLEFDVTTTLFFWSVPHGQGIFEGRLRLCCPLLKDSTCNQTRPKNSCIQIHSSPLSPLHIYISTWRKFQVREHVNTYHGAHVHKYACACAGLAHKKGGFLDRNTCLPISLGPSPTRRFPTLHKKHARLMANSSSAALLSPANFHSLSRPSTPLISDNAFFFFWLRRRGSF